MDLGPSSLIRHRAARAQRMAACVVVALTLGFEPSRSQSPQGAQPALHGESVETATLLRRPIAPAVAIAVSALLESSDEELRSQAGLALAALERGSATAKTQSRLLALSKVSDDAIRLRAIVALGVAGFPGAEARLQTVLNDHRSKADEDAIAAALGLGLLPPDHAGARVGKELTTLIRSGLGRRGALVEALLAGLSRGAHPSVATSILSILETRAREHASLHQLATTVLIHANGVRLKDVEAGLQSNHFAEQDTAIQALMFLPKDALRELSKASKTKLRKLAMRASTDGIRGRALRVLARIRDPEALQIALRVIDSGSAIEAPGFASLVAASVHTIRQLGGGERARALETLALTSKNPTFAVRLLRGCANSTLPPTAGHAAEAARCVARMNEPLELRVAAAQFALAGGNDTVRDALPGLFLASDDRATTEIIAQMMVPHHGWAKSQAAQPIDALLPQSDAADIVRTPARMEALLRANFPGADTHVAERLADPKVADHDKVMLLVAWRRAVAPILSEAAAASLPTSMRRLLSLD